MVGHNRHKDITMKELTKTYILFGPRVSEETKASLRAEFGADEIPADFGPFESGAVHCELYPFLRGERAGKTPEQIAERYQEISAKLKDSHVVVIESTGEQPHVSESIERVRCATSTLKRYGVKQVTLAMPNTAYDRQDRDFAEQGRFCSVNAEWFAKELKLRGADHVVTIAPHSKATIAHWQHAFGSRHYTALQTTELFANEIAARFADTSQVVIGAPDGADKPGDQGQARARELAAAVHHVPLDMVDSELFKIGKRHTGTNETEVTHFEGNVAGKDCVIVDDMSDGGGTLVNAARTLKAHGARSVTAYATHAICTEKESVDATGNRTRSSGLEKLLINDVNGTPIIDQVVFTDSVPEIANKRAKLTQAQQERVSVLSIGPLLASQLHGIAASIDSHAARSSHSSHLGQKTAIRTS